MKLGNAPKLRAQITYIPVAEVEMTEVTALLDGVVQGLIENLNEASHTGKVFVHLSSCGKVAEKKESFRGDWMHNR